MFADDEKVSKGMVKYACGIPKESIVDVGGVLVQPQQPVESATQSKVSAHYSLQKTSAQDIVARQN